jgi:drug/metabolite transporter (DMT)-like permease
LAFTIIYVVWGTTFLAIRIGVREIPPFAFAAARFLLAGSLLSAWMIARRELLPSRRQWMAAVVLALLIFVIDYGCLFWAEQRVPSGITAVMMATIPAFTALGEIILLRTQRLTARLVFALLIGIAGVAVLMDHSFTLGGAPIDTMGAAALIVGAISWSLASVLTRKLPHPDSKAMSSGIQMLIGGVVLALIAAARGEFDTLHLRNVSTGAWLALLYLAIPGSILGFTAYVWLTHHESPTKIGTYAYVNPAIAVLVGYFLGGESLDRRTIVGAVTVLVSVVLITTMRTKASTPTAGIDVVKHLANQQSR